MKKMRMIWIGLFLISLNCSNREIQLAPVKYPITKKIKQIDTYFGTLVSDPYRWLENDTTAETKEWVEAQNKVTFDYLSRIPYREKIKKRLTDLVNYARFSSPFRAGEYYFFWKNDGLQNQDVIYYQKDLDGLPEVFINPNKLSPDGTVSIDLIGFSKDRKYVATSLQRAGSDWQELHVMEIATRRELPDTVRWAKFTGAAWKDDGFYFSRYDAPAKGQELTQRNAYQKIYYHRLGDPQSKDRLVHEDKAHPLRYFNAQTTNDERFLILYISKGTDNWDVYCRDFKDKDPRFKPLFTGMSSKSSVVDNLDGRLIVHTNMDAPNFKVVLLDPKNPSKKNWHALVPEKQNVLESVQTAGGKLFANYLKDASTRVVQYDTTGAPEREIQLPAIGMARGFAGEKDDTVLFYAFTSFTFPSTIFRYNVGSGESTVYKKPGIKFKSENYETKQVFYASRDGTRVPMFIVHKKGLKQDGKNPTLLYGYGGFSISETPNFRQSRIILLENGFVFALPNLRGGGEYGENWHKAGMLLNKQNVFDDFIAAAEYLVREKYTSPEKLAIQGGSNGGLLVGACMTQRPDLFKVALPAVGVMDMLRFQKFTCGFGWVDDYGSSDSPKHFKNLYGYSPLHNIRDGVSYPATLATTADHDDRVVPAHSFKFIATLQEKQTGDNPVLIRIETKAGHGAGKPLSKMIEEQADVWSFTFANLRARVKY
jgi:prolyl oligopeptidase